MYLETRSKTIKEATDKLYEAKACNIVLGCYPNQFTEAQKEVFYEYFYGIANFEEDCVLVVDNIYVNLTDDHIYVLAMADGEDDTTDYYYEELDPNA